MTCNEACNQILDAGRQIKNRAEQPEKLDLSEILPEGYLDPDCIAIGLARVGTPTQSIVVSTLDLFAKALLTDLVGDSELDVSAQLMKTLGGPLHSLIIPGQMHDLEIELLVARFLVSEGHLEDEKIKEGTSLPFVFPPLGEGNLKQRTDAMFARHHELLKECVPVK